MKEYDKRNNQKSSKFHKIFISPINARHPVTKNFIPLHHNQRNYTSLHFTTLVDTSLLTI